MGPTKRKVTQQEGRQARTVTITPIAKRVTQKQIDMKQQKTEKHVKTPITNKRYDSSKDSEKISVSELNHSVIDSNCSVPDSNHSVAKKTNDFHQKSMNSLNDDLSSDGNISDDDEDFETKRNTNKLSLLLETQENGTNNCQLEKDKSTIEEFDACLEQSVIFNKMMENQKLIFEKLDRIASQQSVPSVFSVNKSITVVSLNDEQKSNISTYIQNKFSIIKFLREEEWQLWEQQLLGPIFKNISISNNQDKQEMIKVVKNCSTQCINQKRAEVMRLLKIAVKCK